MDVEDICPEDHIGYSFVLFNPTQMELGAKTSVVIILHSIHILMTL